MNNESNAGKKSYLNFFRFLALLLVISISVIIFIFSSEIKKFSSFGYPGIFLITLLANSTVFLPAPGIAFVFTMGNFLNPLLVAFAASLGGTLGEISGYLAGFSSQAIIDRTDIYKKIEPIILRFGGLAVLLFAAIPNPFFDLAGIAAGALKMPIGKFLIFCWIGQLIKMTCFSLAGYFSLNWVSSFF